MLIFEIRVNFKFISIVYCKCKSGPHLAGRCSLKTVSIHKGLTNIKVKILSNCSILNFLS
jgi:hypothetical protein